MSPDNASLVRASFDALLRGDFEALSAVMDPGVQWRWYEPGEWDCHNRCEVLARLRERRQDGAVTGLEAVIPAGDRVVVVVTGPQLDEGGMLGGRAFLVVTVRDGRIVRMQDHRSRAHALAGAGLAPAPEPPPDAG